MRNGKLINQKEIFFFSNIISLFRLILGTFLLFSFSIIQIPKNTIILFILIAYISDLLDGYFARKLDQISEFGKIIDPLADKIFIFSIALYMMFNDLIPKFLFYSIIVRDVLILLLSLFFVKKMKYVQPSNWVGKITVFIIGIYLLSILMEISIISLYATFFEISIYSLIGFSFIKYITSGLNIIKGKR